MAAEMCGDLAEGIELAVGIPHRVDGERRLPTVGEPLMEEGLAHRPSAEETARFERDERARRERVDSAPLTRMAADYMQRATTWLDSRRDELAGRGDAIVREALDIAGWDACLIGAKLHRALGGRDRAQHHDDDECDDDPVQHDWNGSAKVALISLERSEGAWRVIADASGDYHAAALADAANTLRRTVLEEFPNAMAFVRPGFDER